MKAANSNARPPACFEPRKLPGTKATAPVRCPKCWALAVLPLDDAELAKQPDGTTHVCHPLIGGCNHGFEVEL